MKNNLVKGVLFLILGYLVVCTLMYFIQIQLTFPGSVNQLNDRERILSLNLVDRLKELNWKNDQGENLNGYEIRNSESNQLSHILYFGGNNDDIWKTAPLLNYPHTHVRSLNYPGFALSEGEPSEENILKSMKGWVNSLNFKENDRLTLVGRSLGTGIATQLAYWVQEGKIIDEAKLTLVLITPYDAVWKVGAQRYPWLPVKQLMKTRFESDKFIWKLRIPIHFIYAETDEIVPHSSTDSLISSYTSKISNPNFTIDTVQSVHHNNILDSKFLKQKVFEYSR